jgi:hypothetical protein
MTSLSRNWITENHIDFEYKKYVLLAYLQKVSEEFTGQRLYPSLSELIEHYRNLKELKNNKQNLVADFKSRLKSVDLEQFKLIYEKMAADDVVMQEVESIIDFSLPQFESYLRDGKKIYDFIEDHLSISPVGIIPLHNESGYLMLKEVSSAETRIYQFEITLFENPGERYRGLHIQYVTSYEKSLLNTFESIKSDLLNYNRNLPNPATFVVEADIAIPFEEAFLPIAKRSLIKRIAGNA